MIQELNSMLPNLKTMEITSRYKSPTLRRCPSPNATRTVTTPKLSTSNRAISSERRRPGTPKLPSYPSTPVRDTSVDTKPVSRKANPSPMRSLSVSFSDTFSMPTSKREKPPPQALFDRTLNVSQKPSRKSTPERKRSPLKGKNVIDHSENSKPLESVHSKLVDQHRWPGKVSNKNTDVSHKPMKTFVANKALEKSTSDPVRVVSSFSDKGRLEYDNLRRMSNLVSSRSQSLPLGSKSSSPSRIRPVSPAPLRGVSPLRSCSPLRQSSNSNKVSVLTFIADIKKGKRVVDQIEDAHYLRLLYNRQIQWRFVNASADSALKSQNVTAKKSLFNVWRSTSELRDSVAAKRIDLNQLRMKLELYSVLNQQMAYLNEWDLIEREHNLALSGANEDLQSSTLRVPVTGGAMVDIETMKSSLCSAIQVMQTIGSSIQSTLSRLEGPSSVVSELATVTAQERALLDECEVLLVSSASLQAKEYSLRTHLLQLKQDLTLP